VIFDKKNKVEKELKPSHLQTIKMQRMLEIAPVKKHLKILDGTIAALDCAKREENPELRMKFLDIAIATLDRKITADNRKRVAKVERAEKAIETIQLRQDNLQLSD